MLLLNRKVGETIYVGDNVKIHITEINGNQVKIGFVAPDSIEIHRSEIYEKIHKKTID